MEHANRGKSVVRRSAMAVGKQKLIATGFALVALISLVAAVLPAIKGRSLNVTFFGIGLFWLIVSAIVGRRSNGGAT
jgi:hypothetical protein